ncbi:hypothetical protein DITRI_Ditri17bG0060300 [Diplodiscus trichospermus]
MDDSNIKILSKCEVGEVAEGLNYLHHSWDQVVVHRDIESGNILLDSEKRGRLGDFGLAKLYEHGQFPNTTRVVGTLGYLASELATAAVPTTASDVCSFGVVVLEMAADARIREEYKGEEVEIVLKLRLACCHPDPLRRPTMKKVVATLVGKEVVATLAELLNELACGGSTVGDDGSGSGKRDSR